MSNTPCGSFQQLSINYSTAPHPASRQLMHNLPPAQVLGRHAGWHCCLPNSLAAAGRRCGWWLLLAHPCEPSKYRCETLLYCCRQPAWLNAQPSTTHLEQQLAAIGAKATSSWCCGTCSCHCRAWTQHVPLMFAHTLHSKELPVGAWCGTPHLEAVHWLCIARCHIYHCAVMLQGQFAVLHRGAFSAGWTTSPPAWQL